MRKLFLCTLVVAVVWVHDAAAANRTAVVNNFGCSISATASGLGTHLWTDGKTQAVTNESGSLLQCHFDIPEHLRPNRPIKNKGFRCGTFMGVTYDSTAVATPGGALHLKCQVRR